MLRKNLLLTVLVLFYSLIAFSCSNTDDNHVTDGKQDGVINFTEDTTGIFCNPERGWQKTFNPNYSDNMQSPVYTETQLKKLRAENITLVDKYYILYSFRNSAISAEYLENFQKDMDMLRKVGLKAVIRFAYNFNGNDLADAPVNIVLQHISQLKPYLQNNYDVIAFMEAGFIGEWAEWHGSKNGLVGGVWSIGVNDNTRSIYNAILDALPIERMIAIRYVFQMQDILNQANCQSTATSTYSFSDDEAFSGSTKARTGRHDDFFFVDNNSCWGTWSDQNDARECQKSYLQRVSKYVPITTGETGGTSAFLESSSPLGDLARFHFASLSVNPDGNAADPIRHWQKTGAFEIMARRFGYRFVLHEATIPDACKAEGNLSFSFKIENKGFGGVYNPRLFEVVLRSKTGGQEYHLNITKLNGNELDPRYWFRENGIMTKTVDVKLEGVPAGTYELLLNLPDPMEKLYGRPEFSIRLANKNMWEETTGYNNLKKEITIN